MILQPYFLQSWSLIKGGSTAHLPASVVYRVTDDLVFFGMLTGNDLQITYTGSSGTQQTEIYSNNNPYSCKANTDITISGNGITGVYSGLLKASIFVSYLNLSNCPELLEVDISGFYDMLNETNITTFLSNLPTTQRGKLYCDNYSLFETIKTAAETKGWQVYNTSLV
ncbi:MAG: hypothetical protein ACI392_06645 [Paludibacteraceae bacterium]